MKSWTNCFSASVPAERLALVRALAHQLDRALGRADRAHAVVDAAGAEAVLGDHEAARRARRAGCPRARGSPRSVISQWPGPPSWPITDTGRTRLKPGASVGHEDHARALVRRGVGVGHDHRDRQVGAHCARGEPLVPVDDPLAVRRARRARRGWSGPSRRCRARSSRSTSGSWPFEQRLEPALLLLGRAVLGQDLHVARVGRRAVEDHRRHEAERPMTSQSIPYSQLVRPAPCSSSGRKRFHSPSAFARSRSSTRIVRVGRRPGATSSSSASHQLALDRVVVLVEERVDALAQLGDAIGGREVHRRGGYRLPDLYIVDQAPFRTMPLLPDHELTSPAEPLRLTGTAPRAAARETTRPAAQPASWIKPQVRARRAPRRRTQRRRASPLTPDA